MSFNQVDNKPIAKRQQSTLRFLSLITLGFSPKMKLLIMIYLLVTLSSNYGVNYVNAGASPMYWRVSIILSNNTLYLPEKTDMLRMIKYFLDVKEEPIFCIEGKTFIHNQIIYLVSIPGILLYFFYRCLRESHRFHMPESLYLQLMHMNTTQMMKMKVILQLFQMLR